MNALAIIFAVLLAQVSPVTVSGSVFDDTGVPIAGAIVHLSGPQSSSATSDSAGQYSVSVEPGLYTMTVTKAGYQPAQQSDFAVVEGQPQTIAVHLVRATLTSLQTIATVRTGGRGSFNTTPASINVVPAQVFVDQAQPQVTRVLNQLPNVQISFPGNSANAAAPGAITVPTIRGAASYETASLIDGHPLAVGQYGDYVTTFLSSYLLGSVEVVKGPGADAPEVNGAIGGTINFRTKDPTKEITPTFLYGFDSHGGNFGTLGLSGTTNNGKLGFVIQVANLDEPSALNNTKVLFDPNFGQLPDGSSLGQTTTSATIPNTLSNNTNSYQLLACCFTIQGDLETTGELLKLKYQFSGATSATVSYLGGQSFSDQSGNTGNITYAAFTPADPTYNGSLKANSVVPVDFIFPGAPTRETNNEPMFQAEVSSAIGADTLLARYYHASISRLQYQGSSPSYFDPLGVTLYGTSSNGQPTYNGTQTTVGFQDFFRENEQDKLSGLSFEYLHPFTNGGDVAFSVDQANSQTLSYSEGINFATNGISYSPNVPGGSSQLFTTYLLRGHLLFGPKLTATISDYVNTYRNTFVQTCPLDRFGNYQCNVDGSNATFTTTNTAHNDPRLGLVYRANPNLALRFAAGSSIAPTYLGLLSNVPGNFINYDSTNNIAYITTPNALIRPETAFGYDLGGDLRLKDGVTTVSADLYQSNLFNHFFGQTIPTGQTCTPTTCPGIPAGTPLYDQTTINLSNFRFAGAELVVRRNPQKGFGYSVAGGLERGYAYNLPPGFYCSTPITATTPCTPATYNQNQTIIPNQNINGEGVGFGSGLNTRIPYFQGNAEVSYRTANGWYANLGETFYGKNNSLNEPPFPIAYANLRVPIANSFSIQISGDNIFNAYPGLIPIYGGGVPISVAGPAPGQAATTANVLGPATWRFILTKQLP